MTATLSPPERPSPPHDHPPTQEGSQGLAQSLGWFSIGLGLAQIAAPAGIARMVGLRNSAANRNTLRALGVREITSGAGILLRPRSSRWMWARVAGDALDLAVLARAAGQRGSDRNRLAVATAGVAAVTLVDVVAARKLSRLDGDVLIPRPRSKSVHVVRVITVGRPPDEVHRFWRALDNLPRFMTHLEAVIVLDDRRSHWKAKAPAGASVEWDAEIVEDRPDLLAWRSLPGAGLPNAGSVRFSPAPGGRGTEVRVELRYDPPGGTVGAMIAKLFGEEPGPQVDADLRRFKQVMETGEVVHSDASIHGGMHPAQPPEIALRPELASNRGGMES